MSTDVIAEMSDLINKGKFARAATVGRKNKEEDASDSGHFWFQYGLAKTLTGVDGTPEYLMAIERPDCTDVMRADILRDIAMIAARRGQIRDALSYLRQSASAVDDVNRLAAVHMAAGRIATLDGRHQDAIEYHEWAHVIWLHAGPDADPQWIMNNRFYWLRAKALLERPRFELYRDLIASPEQRRDRRRSAALFFFGGPAAAAADVLRERAGNVVFGVRALLDENIYEINELMEYHYD